jgi:hypothetical protein
MYYDLDSICAQRIILDDIEVPRWLVVQEPAIDVYGDSEGQALSSLLRERAADTDVCTEFEYSAVVPVVWTASGENKLRLVSG